MGRQSAAQRQYLQEIKNMFELHTLRTGFNPCPKQTANNL